VDRFGHRLPADCIAFGERYVERHSRFITRHHGPKASGHGDFRGENILFRRGRATIVDWQTTAASNALMEAAYSTWCGAERWRRNRGVCGRERELEGYSERLDDRLAGGRRAQGGT
jgi:aminoglycoside phosphotransferase (APT) family kinase protein